MINQIHQSVLLKEVIEYLKPAPGKRYIDATLGGAGHTRALINAGAEVLGIDQDKSVLDYVKATFKDPQLKVVEANFMTIKTQADKCGFTKVDGILFDLGVSSLQFDTPDRGFSFQNDAPLDMRMNQSSGETAKDLINNSTEDELFEILINNAQEPNARSIAAAIVAHRPIETTKQLSDLVLQAYHGRRGRIHPATLTFQAIRIAVNQELKVIKPAIKDAASLLNPNGKIAVISFHEGEDRIVKRTFIELQTGGNMAILTKNPVIPTEAEIKMNPRARSAKLRVIESTP